MKDQVREADRLLHVLWTKAVGTEGYVKDEWKALEAAIWAMAREPQPKDPVR